MKSLSIILVLVFMYSGAAYGACQRIQSDTAHWIGPAPVEATTTTNDGIEAVYCGPLLWDSQNTTLDVYMVWDGTLVNADATAGNIREKDGEELKVYAGEHTTERIYKEQEIRGVTLLGVRVPRDGYDLMQELYVDILVSAARNSVDEQGTPIWWGVKELWINRNTLLSQLDALLADPTKTAEDILALDVENWPGWGVPRPPE